MKNCALILFFLLPAIFVYNQISWEQLSGPYGGEVNRLDGDPDNYLFAVVQQNILFRSDNYGQNWESVPNTPTELSSSKIFMGFDHKLYALEASTLYVSEDNGDSWQEVAQQAGLFSANVLPSGTIVGSTNGYILHSEDNGMTWDSIGIQTVVGGNEFRYDTISNRVFTFYTYQGKIHQSFDDGLTWSVLFDQGGERIYDIAVDIAGNLWVLGDNLIWFSSDNGANWASSSVLETGTSDINYGQIVALPNGRVWVRQGNTAFFTDDYGQTWDQNRFSFSDIFGLSDGSFWFSRGTNGLHTFANDEFDLDFKALGMNYPYLRDMVINDQGHVYVLTGGGLFRSMDNQQSWEYFPIKVDRVFSNFDLALNHSGDLYLIYFGVILKFDEANTSFLEIPLPETLIPPLQSQSLGFHPDGTMFLCAFQGIYRTTNEGMNWDFVLDNAFTDKMEIHPSGNIYVQSSFELFQSTDQGESWNELIPPDDPYVFHVTQDEIIYVGDYNGFIHWTTDQGATWNSALVDQENSYGLVDIVSNVAGHLFATTIFEDELFWSVDQGLSWSIVPPYTSDYFIRYDYLYIPADQHLYTGYYQDGFFRSVLPTTDVTLLQGNLKVIENADCTIEADDPVLPDWIIQSDGAFEQYSMTNAEGNFLMLAIPGTYNIQAVAPSPYWEACPQEVIIEAADLQQDTLGPVELAVQAITSCPFLEVDISTSFLRRCFPNTYTLRYCNQGTATAENIAIEVDLDPFMILENISVPYTQSGDQISFSLGSLMPGDCGTIYIDFTLSCEAELGMEHCVTARISPDTPCLPDIITHTTDQECQFNIGAFDPNDKRAFVDGRISEDYLPPGSSLEYQIRFQNTGTDTAFTVVILDTIATELDIATLRPGASSHPYELEILDSRVLQFTFEDIMLPDSNINEAASHGFVNLQIAPREGLPLGALIQNNAAIYFDFNDPVITNTAALVYDELVAIPPNPEKQIQRIKVFPNPAQDYTTFLMPSKAFDSYVLQILDANGKKVLETTSSKNQFQITTKQWPNGLYGYRLFSDNALLGSGKFIVMKHH